MGTYFDVENFDDLFNGLINPPIILNDLSTSTEDDKDNINKLITTKYVDTDLLSNEPSCECGELTGGYNLSMICSNCNSAVTEPFEQELKPLVWLRSPHGVNGLINPDIWSMLKDEFKKSDFNFIEWMTNTDYTPTTARPPEVDELANNGVIRGYNNFINNFFHYIDLLYRLPYFKEKDGPSSLRILLNNKKDCIFSTYLPLPNKSLLIIEDNANKVYIDKMAIGAIDAIRTFGTIDDPLYGYKIRQKENRTVKTIDKLAAFYKNIYGTMLAKKGGIIRKHIFGSRNHFSARAVIVSNTDAHAYDELYLGWSLAVTMLGVHIKNKLFRRGFTPNMANSFLQQYTNKYNEDLDNIFNELLAESKDGCFWVTWNRNPSLGRGSIQRLKVTRIKKDPNDTTVTMSILDTAAFNADKYIMSY